MTMSTYDHHLCIILNIENVYNQMRMEILTPIYL